MYYINKKSHKSIVMLPDVYIRLFPTLWPVPVAAQAVAVETTRNHRSDWFQSHKCESGSAPVEESYQHIVSVLHQTNGQHISAIDE